MQVTGVFLHLILQIFGLSNIYFFIYYWRHLALTNIYNRDANSDTNIKEKLWLFLCCGIKPVANNL